MSRESDEDEESRRVRDRDGHGCTDDDRNRGWDERNRDKKLWKSS